MNIAHIKNDEIQTTEEHCLSVSEKTGLFAKDLNSKCVGELAGLLHDVGKLCEEFNSYITGDINKSRGEIDHSYAGAKYIIELASKRNDCKTSARFVGRVISTHHGLRDHCNPYGKDCFGERISKSENYGEILSNIGGLADEDDIAALMKKSDDEYTAVRKRLKDISKSKQEFAFYLGMYERITLSALVDADRTDTADFMSGTSTEIQFTDIQLNELWEQMSNSMNDKLNGFADKTDPISMRRKDISERCFNAAEKAPGTYKLIVPTGGGKTLSSLRFAIEHCKINGMKHIFYIAPFKSILEQNSDEIVSIAGEENFLEHHSDLVSDIESEDELLEYELRTEKWDVPVIATTMVQFLNSLFSGKLSAVRRMHRLSKSVIIIDEVQSIPLKCVNMFNLAMNFLSQICGSTIVLCSATQPVFDQTEYPLIYSEGASLTGDYSKDFEIFKRTDIIPQIEKYGYSYREAADFCLDKIKAFGNMLLIVNTKNAALEMYKLLKDSELPQGTRIIHLSTNMCPQSRRDKIKEMCELLKSNKPVVCVATQLIEAGVDVSFKCVVRSMAGLDNVAQAAGRCNRHGESDKPCPVYIIKIKDENVVKLREITEAQSISLAMIDNEKYVDYSSVETLSAYYKELFRRYEGELNYKVEREKTTLLDMLSLNRKWHAPAISSDYKKQNLFSAQAFKTAGQYFEVINSDTINVIAPYNDEAEKIIIRLNETDDLKEVMSLLRRSQKYSVSLYRGTQKKLTDNNALYQLKCGAIALKKEFYNDEFGITADGSLMELLMF